jgi:RNA polymerase-binding transcription factor DksA
MTATVHSSTGTAGEPMELLRTMLEERFAVHTRRLTEFTVYGRLPDRGGFDQDTLGMLATAARQEIADSAQALQRMSQGTYGICEGCHRDIPLRRLHTLPHARRCVPCERRGSE